MWAAFGDALGFISALANEAQLRRRISRDVVETTVAWKRRVGGKFGIDVDLPAGCYSDDTQLRLATCRAIRGDGAFDVEAFAKVELPVWLSYGLGGGARNKGGGFSARAARDNLGDEFFRGEKSVRGRRRKRRCDASPAARVGIPTRTER